MEMLKVASSLPAFSQDMVDLLTIFNKQNVRFLIVGAHAVNSYTEPRATKDIDILVEPTPENASNVFIALKEFGAPLEGVKISDFEDTENFFIIGIKPNRVDILKKIPGLDFSFAWSRKKEIKIDGISFFIPGIEDLLVAKKAAGRPQDLVDASKLEKALSKLKNEFKK